MKVALLHYWLTNIRGGEKVFLELCKIFPDADIFTHVISPEIRNTYFPSGRTIHTSFINCLPYPEKFYKNYLPLMFKAVQSWNFSGYDLIISSESGPVKGVIKPAGVRHICYCHTPPRYIWDMFDEYYKHAPVHKKTAMRCLKNYLRRQDLNSTKNVDFFIANSKHVCERIKRIYSHDAKVIYPPVNIEFFSRETKTEKSDYYVMVGELVQYKRPDIAIEAFNINGKKLIVVGSGEEYKSLKKSADRNISFTGRVGDIELRSLYGNARALIFPGIEDFGIVPLEAQATGTPVIAYGCGGVLETVIDGETGLFFSHQTPEALNRVICEFERSVEIFEPEKLKLHAEKFSRHRFHTVFKSFLEDRLY